MEETKEKAIEYYITQEGKIPFNQWYESLKDKRATEEVARRLNRAIKGNFGDHKILAEDLYEMRITYGPAYRIYHLLQRRPPLQGSEASKWGMNLPDYESSQILK
jgi:putative addiction module killer protein